MIRQLWPRSAGARAIPAPFIVHPSDELARLAAEMSAEYVDACHDLNTHIAGCWSVCRGGRGWTLCEAGDQIVGRMLDALGFDDDLNEWDRLEAMGQ